MARLFQVIAPMLALTTSSFAGITIPDNMNFIDWIESTPDATLIDFVGLPDATQISDQYIELGVRWEADPDRSVVLPFSNIGGYPTDGHGQFSSSWQRLVFTEPQRAIAFQGNGLIIRFFDDSGELIAESGGGSTSSSWQLDEPFSAAEIVGQGATQPNIDNLYFSAVPAPGTVVLFGLVCISGRRRR